MRRLLAALVATFAALALVLPASAARPQLSLQAVISGQPSDPVDANGSGSIDAGDYMLLNLRLRVVGSNPLASPLAGRGSAFGTVTGRIMFAGPGASLMDAQISIAGGTLVARGYGNFDRRPFVIPLYGSSGPFRGVAGQLVITPTNDDGAIATLNLYATK